MVTGSLGDSAGELLMGWFTILAAPRHGNVDREEVAV
jgi:hypothetical protein